MKNNKCHNQSFPGEFWQGMQADGMINMMASAFKNLFSCVVFQDNTVRLWNIEDSDKIPVVLEKKRAIGIKIIKVGTHIVNQDPQNRCATRVSTQDLTIPCSKS